MIIWFSLFNITVNVVYLGESRLQDFGDVMRAVINCEQCFFMLYRPTHSQLLINVENNHQLQPYFCQFNLKYYMCFIMNCMHPPFLQTSFNRITQLQVTCSFSCLVEVVHVIPVQPYGKSFLFTLCLSRMFPLNCVLCVRTQTNDRHTSWGSVSEWHISCGRAL